MRSLQPPVARASHPGADVAAAACAAGIGAAAVPLAAYASGEALPPLASAGLAALFAGASREKSGSRGVGRRSVPSPPPSAGAGAASGALWYYSRRYVGELALLGPPGAQQRVRISTLDFWGAREETVVPRAAVTPPLPAARREELRAAAAAPVLPLDGASRPRAARGRCAEGALSLCCLLAAHPPAQWSASASSCSRCATAA